MNYRLKMRDILYNDDQLGPYPDQLLPRVDKITTEIVGKVERSSPTSFRSKGHDNGKQKDEQIALRKALCNVRDYMCPKDEDLNVKRTPPSEVKGLLPDDPRVLSRHMKSLGYFLGADEVGICEVPEGAIYTDEFDLSGRPVEVPFKYAIVFLKRKQMATSLASSGNDYMYDPCSHQAYNELALISETVSEYLRIMGWDTQVNNVFYNAGPVTPLILAAGLGEGSRLGIALNPFFGANMKGAAVYTDLPMEVDKPIDFGLQDYCEHCTICYDACPSKSISNREKEYHNGYVTWVLNKKRCSAFGGHHAGGAGCGRCTRVCPWNRPDSTPQDFKDWDGDLQFLYDSVNARAKYLRDHDLHDEEEQTNKWWFDMEKVDDKFIIPKTTEWEPLDDEARAMKEESEREEEED